MKRDPLLAPLRDLLNRQIDRTPAARTAADDLEGRTLAIRLRNTGLVLYLGIADERLELARHPDGEPDAILETTPFGLAELARGRAAGGQLAMTGDPVVAQHFEQLLRETRPDWEEELSRIVGDVAAHQVGELVRSLLGFGKRAADSLSRDTAEYLREERRELAAPAEIEAFISGVDRLAAEVSELASRIARLRAQAGE